ncbi:MAG: DNA mismatch repair protein MutL, partial [Tenericutes bacterium]|nr:DNA mismatch repair protein MutL [Mycoplasmatota bacterium]
MKKINIMDEQLANKIAAGEVVERIANVVKELVENSIDAKSSNIKVELLESGTKLIKIVDDGTGMSKEDALLCFSRHATSKIKTENDLFFINSLGFRGEALAAISSVSNIIL